MDVNVDIFKKYSADKKLELLENATESELLFLAESTLMKIIKEVGERQNPNSKEHHKDLVLINEVGNGWNSIVKFVSYTGNHVYLGINLNYGCEEIVLMTAFSQFDKFGTYRDSYIWNSIKGPQTTYYTYNETEKAAVYKEILRTYIIKKYEK